MITILASDSYKGFSAPLQNYQTGAEAGAQPIFVGRVLWPGCEIAEDAVIKMYQITTCGTANEVIGYAANAARGIKQPKKSAVLLLSKKELPKLGINYDDFIDKPSGLTACWVTSFEQGARPFNFVRRLSSFSEKKATAFYKSKFCRLLASVDHVTGNSDRHEGNFLYLDDFNYLAIDQGCVGGGLHWHINWLDLSPRNELFQLAQHALSASELSEWKAEAIMEHERSQPAWPAIFEQLRPALTGLLEADAIEIIVEYMVDRAGGPKFAVSCGKLI